MNKITACERNYLKGYAQALQDLMLEVTDDNTCSKSYDPIDFTDGVIHSYAFNLKDGGRHHPMSDYESIDEVAEYMLREAADWLYNEADYIKQKADQHNIGD